MGSFTLRDPNDIGVAVLGAGRMGQTHVRNMAAIPNAHVVVVADPVPAAGAVPAVDLVPVADAVPAVDLAPVAGLNVETRASPEEVPEPMSPLGRTRMVTVNGMMVIAAVSASLYAPMIALARARNLRIVCMQVSIIKGFTSPTRICSLVTLSSRMRTTLIPILVLATYDAAAWQPLPRVAAAVDTEDANLVTATICPYAASAPLPVQLAKTVRDRAANDPASDIIAASTVSHWAPRPASLSSSACGNLPLTTDAGMSGEVYWAIMWSSLRFPDRC